MKDYDYNIYGSDTWTIKLSAYKIYVDVESGLTRTDTNDFITKVFTLVDNPEEVKYLLDSEEPEKLYIGGIQDYDDWVGYEYLTQGNTPIGIIEWLDSLPDYEMENR